MPVLAAISKLSDEETPEPKAKSKAKPSPKPPPAKAKPSAKPPPQAKAKAKLSPKPKTVMKTLPKKKAEEAPPAKPKAPPAKPKAEVPEGEHADGAPPSTSKTDKAENTRHAGIIRIFFA